MVSGSTTLGDEERQIVDDVFDAGARSLREVMLPRTEVDFLPGDMPAHKAVRELLKAPHSRYPVMGESADDIIGFVHVRDLLDPEVSSRTTPVSEVARPVISLPDTVRVLHALSEMRRTANHLAIVLDEYGGTAGIVTMEDLVEELVGDITDEYDVVTEERTTLRGDQVIDGLTTLDDFAERTGLVLPDGPYDTLAGFFMASYGQLPILNASVEVEVQQVDDEDGEPVRTELRVLELDGRRASSIAVRRTSEPPAGAADTPRRAGRIRPRAATEATSAHPSRTRHGLEPASPRSRAQPSRRHVRHDDAHVCQATRAVVGPADRRLAASRQLPGCAAAVGAAAGQPRRLLRGRRSARAGRQPRSRGSAHRTLRTRRPDAGGRDRPGAGDGLRPVARPRAHPAGLGARRLHRLRPGQPDDPVQGQVRRAAGPTP